MPVVRMDEKGRIQLPSEVRKQWHLKPRQPLIVEMERDTLLIKKSQKLDHKTDPLLRDILVKPGRSKMKVTKALLKRLEDEAWTP